MEQWIIYIACGIGAIGLYLLLAMRQRSLKVAGGLVGLAALAWLIAELIGRFTTDAGEIEAGAGDAPPVLFYVFAVIAVAAAGRMITHHRPVYSALYFVMVVLSSATVFLFLEAEFMAFALVIVYAGAILITYLFVLMLAQQAPVAGEEEETPAYDRIPHEPAAAVGVGFLMLALLGQVIFDRTNALPPAAGPQERIAAAAVDLNQMPKKREAMIEAFHAVDENLPRQSRIAAVDAEGVTFIIPPTDIERTYTWEEAGLTQDEIEGLLLKNIERVGWALVAEFPVSLELAGVILLMAMFGAVVLARKQIELGEDEKREAAGLRRMTTDPAEPSREVGAEGGSA